MLTKAARDTVERFAASLEPRMRAAFLDGLAQLRSTTVLRRLEEAIASASPYGVEVALGTDKLEDAFAAMRDVIIDALRGGAEVAATHLRPVSKARRPRPKPAPRVGVAIRFDVTDDRTLAYIRNYTGRLISEISSTTRAGIQRLVADEFRRGGSPQQMARRIRDRIGLTHYQEQIASNYEATLRAAVRGEATWAEVNAYKLNPIRGAGGLVENRIDAAVSQFRDRLLNARAENIARTETMSAAHAGQEELWQQLQRRGAIPPGAEREWLTAPDERVCPVCAELDGERAEIGGSYPGGIDRPPAHPSCRCTEVLVGL